MMQRGVGGMMVSCDRPFTLTEAAMVQWERYRLWVSRRIGHSKSQLSGSKEASGRGHPFPFPFARFVTIVTI